MNASISWQHFWLSSLFHLCQLSTNASFHSKTPNMFFILNTNILCVICIGWTPISLPPV